MANEKIVHDKLIISNQVMNVGVLSSFLKDGLKGYEMDRGIKVSLNIQLLDKRVTEEEIDETQ